MDDQGGVPNSTDFIWEEAGKRLDAQIDQANALDSKAGILLGVLGLAGGLVAAAAVKVEGSDRTLFALLILGLLVAGALASEAFRAQSYDRRPAPETLWADANWTAQQLKYRFLSTRFRAVDENRRKLNYKARMLNYSLLITTLLGLVVALTGALRMILP